MSCYAGIAQLVEHYLAKVDVASSSLVSRSIIRKDSSLRAAFLRLGLAVRTRLVVQGAVGTLQRIDKYGPTLNNGAILLTVHRYTFYEHTPQLHCLPCAA